MIRCILAIIIPMGSWASHARSAEPGTEADLKKAVATMRRTGDVTIPEEKKKGQRSWIGLGIHSQVPAPRAAWP